jgi:hypothetical protein
MAFRELINFRDGETAVSPPGLTEQLSSPARMVFTISTAHAINDLMTVYAAIS